MTWKQAQQDKRFLNLSEGNRKLIPNESIRFLIWNLPSRITCPFATKHCFHFCYAVKAENAYPNCKTSRLRNLERSKESDFVESMIFTIEAHLDRPSFKTAKKVIVRIHESGEFYNQAYADKWLKIAEHFKHNKRVVFMAYTKSIVFFSNNIYSDKRKYIPPNMVIRFSVWDDTKADYIRLAERWDFPIYTAVDKFSKGIPSQNRCLCRDCAKCGKCWGKTKKIVCEIH